MARSATSRSPDNASVNHPAIAMLGVLTICVYGAWYYAFGVLLDPIRDDTGWRESSLAGSYSWGLLVIGLGSVFGGRLLDRFGSRTVFLAAALLGFVTFGVASVATNVIVFVAAASLGMGVFGSLGFYHITMTVAVRLNPDSAARAIAVLTLWGAVSSAIYLPLAAWLVDATGWRTTMRVLVGSALVALVIAAAVIPVDPAAEPEQRTSLARSIKVMLSNPQARLFALVLAAGGTCWTSLLVYQVPTMTAVGLPLATASAVAGLRGFCQLFGRLPIGWLVDRIGADGSLILSFATMVVGGVLLAFSGTLWVAILFAVIAGFGIGAFSPLQGIRAEQLYDRDMLGAAMGFLGTVVMLSGAIAPVVIGLIAERTGERRWVTVFVVVAGMTAIALVDRLRRQAAAEAALA